MGVSQCARATVGMHTRRSDTYVTSSSMRKWKLLLGIFLFRLLNSFSVQTFFQPDEFYQSLEPAHKLVYGYGYITWEWDQALRSSIHPLLYALSYKIGEYLNDFLSFVTPSLAQLIVPHTVAPKVLNAIIASLADFYTLRFSNMYWGDNSLTLLILSLGSGWNWYILTRSFLNNLETLLTVVGLSYWPWHLLRLKPYSIACICGFFSCVIRPTNALIWGLLAVQILYRNASRLFKMISLSLCLLALTLAVSAMADRFYYGKWTFPIYNFLEFNVVKNLLIFYGSNPWHFYIFQGLPLMMMGYTPALILAAVKFKSSSILVSLSVIVVLAFSLIAHKEFRFLQPIYPILVSLSAKYIDGHFSWTILTKAWVTFTLVLHLSTAYFFSRVNERGEIDVIETLKVDQNVKSIGLLTPCHSTPWHSTLHRPELVNSSWFLTCEPPLHLSSGNAGNVREYRDELDRFFDDPVSFIQHLPYEWPSHLVVFEPMENLIKEELPRYKECHRFFNSFVHWDSRRQGDIIVFCEQERE